MRKTLTVPTPRTPQADPLLELGRLDGVASAQAAAQAAVDVVLRGLPRRRISEQQSVAALTETTRASAQLEPDPERWTDGADRLAAELPVLTRQIRVAPGNVLARMHLLLARGVSTEAELGRTRGGIDGARLTALTRLLTTPTTASALVLAAIAHAELVSLQPFGAGSGVIARAVEHLVLMEAGIDPVGMIMIERGHVDAGAEYAAARQAYATGTPLGVARWLSHSAAAVARGAELSPLAR